MWGDYNKFYKPLLVVLIMAEGRIRIDPRVGDIGELVGISDKTIWGSKESLDRYYDMSTSLMRLAVVTGLGVASLAISFGPAIYSLARDYVF